MMAHLQNEHVQRDETLGAQASMFVTVTLSKDDQGCVVPRGFMASDLCMNLLRSRTVEFLTAHPLVVQVRRAQRGFIMPSLSFTDRQQARPPVGSSCTPAGRAHRSRASRRGAERRGIGALFSTLTNSPGGCASATCAATCAPRGSCLRRVLADFSLLVELASVCGMDVVLRAARSRSGRAIPTLAELLGRSLLVKQAV